MYYYKARMYSPTLGRFMQTDPIGYSDGMNMYAYVGNDPVNAVDPTGLCTIFTTYRLVGVSVGGGATSWGWRPTGTSTLGCGGGGAAGGDGGSNPTSAGVINAAAAASARGPQELDDEGHDYTVYGTICRRALNKAEMRDILSRFSLPGHSGKVAKNGDYTVYQWGLPGGRVRVRFSNNGLSVRNTTLNPHIFAGQIDRKIYSDRFGTFTTTRGTGTADFLGGSRDWLNQQLGPGIFEGLNEDAAAYAKEKFEGC